MQTMSRPRGLKARTRRRTKEGRYGCVAARHRGLSHRGHHPGADPVCDGRMSRIKGVLPPDLVDPPPLRFAVTGCTRPCTYSLRAFSARVKRFTYGCVGEAAFCHAYGLPYVTGATFESRHEPDQHGCEVRATRPGRNLLVRPDDKDDRPAVCVWMEGPAYRRGLGVVREREGRAVVLPGSAGHLTLANTALSIGAPLVPCEIKGYHQRRAEHDGRPAEVAVTDQMAHIKLLFPPERSATSSARHGPCRYDAQRGSSSSARCDGHRPPHPAGSPETSP